MNPLIMKVMRKITDTDSENPSLDDLLDKSDAIFEEVAVEPVRSANDSNERHTFGFGSPFETMSPGQVAGVMPSMVREQLSFRRSMRLAREHEQRAGEPAESSLSREIESRLRKWGAAEIGFVAVPPRAVYRDRVAPLRNVIVFTGEMDREILKTAPTFEGMREVVDAYARTGVMANRLTEYLRDRGFNAIPGHSMGGTVNYPLLGELAGIGKLGRNGLLISKTHGVSQRIAVVFTDVEGLDLGDAEEYEWVLDFCKACGKCIEACPVGALRRDYATDAHGKLISADGDLCLPYFGANWGCSICVGVCPFTRSEYTHIKGSWERRLERESASLVV